MNKLQDVPSHNDFPRPDKSAYGHLFGRLDKLNKLWVSGQFGKLDLKSLSTRHVSLMGCALYGLDEPERAYNHLMLSLYYAVKGVERLLLLPCSAEEATTENRHEQPFYVNIYGAQVKCPVLTYQHKFYYASEWYHHFWSAVLLGNQQDMAYLAEIRYDPMIEWFDDANRLFGDILVAFFQLEPHDLAQKFQAFAAASEPNKIDSVSFNHATLIKLPILEVMQQMFSGDEQLFRQSMRRAALSHYEFYQVEKYAIDSHGDISFALTALARIAYQQFGYTLGFKTGYIPEYFYKTEGQSIDFGPLTAPEIADA